MTPNSQVEQATFRVSGLDCPDELALITRGLSGIRGIGRCEPNYVQQTLRVEFNPAELSAAQVAEAITRTGFAADLTDGRLPTTTVFPQGRATWTTLAGGGLLALAGLFFAVRWPTLARGLAVVSAAVSGTPVVRAAVRALRLGTWDMNVLMTAAALGAVATGEPFEAATAMFLFGVSLALERLSMNRARRAVRFLAELSSSVAHRLVDGRWVDVDPQSLVVGDQIRVRPGERVPVDARVQAGRSSVNQAAITGESLPVDKVAGESVLAGSLNGESSLDLVVERVAAESTLARIARLVESAQAARSPTQRLVDRFAQWYSPLVIVLAALVVAVPLAASAIGVEWAARVSAIEWFHRGLVLLVIACPCALVISTPVTIVCGLYQAARQGFLVKGGEHLERAAQVTAIAFDKTGTLTTGRWTVDRVLPTGSLSPDDVLQLAASLEAHSQHPLAAAIRQAAENRGLRPREATRFESLPALGVAAEIDGERYVLGSPRVLEQHGDRWPGGQAAGDWQNVAEIASSATRDSLAAATTLVLVRSGQPLGTLELSDEIRPEAPAAVERLRRAGIERFSLLTGDRAASARAVAAAVGIDHIRAELTPEDKLRAIRHLADDRRVWAMVGDGVNDAPALAAAPLGIAWGRGASDTALETADVVALSTRLERLADLFLLARRTRGVLHQNIALAIGVKLSVLFLAADGRASMWLALAADVGASLLVISNGMRLVRRPRHGAASHADHVPWPA